MKKETVKIKAGEEIGKISPLLYGHFAEQIGNCGNIKALSNCGKASRRACKREQAGARLPFRVHMQKQSPTALCILAAKANEHSRFFAKHKR